MNAQLPKNLKKYAAIFPLLISAFIVTSVQSAQSESLILFHSPETATPARGGDSRIIQQKILKLDEKGDLLVQCGCARFTVAYNAPADQFKPSELQQNPARERTGAINGISLTASLTF